MSGGPPFALTVVIPAHDEEPVLEASISALARHVDVATTEIVIVDDGSRDHTATIAADVVTHHPGARLIRFPTNRGKGAAVRAGVATSTGAAVLFMDADLSTSLEHVGPVLDLLASYDIVIGSRSVPGATVDRSSILRVAMGRSFNTLMRWVTGLPVRDSQCGFKAFPGEVARALFALAECDGYAFDPEVLRIADVLGCTMVEQPVQWTAAPRSAVRPVRDSLRTGIDLIFVRWSTRASRVESRARRLGIFISTPVTPRPAGANAASP